mmetsp:Transcript_22394/g.42238  ORF Transcript_22394/g.42238 Transcript_22394/m.42238 type:complete len:251 (-) Transcript_22394:385-1137(-)
MAGAQTCIFGIGNPERDVRVVRELGVLPREDLRKAEMIHVVLDLVFQSVVLEPGVGHGLFSRLPELMLCHLLLAFPDGERHVVLITIQSQLLVLALHSLFAGLKQLTPRLESRILDPLHANHLVLAIWIDRVVHRHQATTLASQLMICFSSLAYVADGTISRMRLVVVRLPLENWLAARSPVFTSNKAGPFCLGLSMQIQACPGVVLRHFVGIEMGRIRLGTRSICAVRSADDSALLLDGAALVNLARGI